MKSTITLISIILALTTVAMSQTAATDTRSQAHRTSFKSGVVVLRGILYDSTEQTIYFEDYGMTQAVCTRSTARGAGLAQVSIYRDSMMYSYSLADTLQKGTKKHRSEIIREPITDLLKLSDTLKSILSFRTLKDRKYMGKVCSGFGFLSDDVYTKMWCFENVPMMVFVQTSETSAEGDGFEPAWETTLLQTDIEIDPARFRLPSSIVFLESRGYLDKIMHR